MKIMLICPLYGPPWNEGGKNFVRVLDERLPDFGVDVVVCPEKNDCQTTSSSKRSSLSVIVRKLFFWWRATRQARDQGVDAIHLLSSVSSILGIKSFFIRSLSGIPLVLHITGLENPIHGHTFLLRADRIIVGGNYLKEFFSNALSLPPVSPHMNPRIERETGQLGISQNPSKVLYLGAMEAVRGVHTLVDALAVLKKHFKLRDFTATLAWNGYGDANYAQEIRRKIEEHEIQRHVCWWESVEDVSGPYRTHDIVVIPRASRERMGFPLRLIEAMSYGKPVVVSDLGEMPRIIGQCGLVFPHEDAGSLAEALQRLLSDRSLYKECAENCYQKAKEYHPSRTIRRLVDLYREIALGG